MTAFLTNVWFGPSVLAALDDIGAQRRVDQVEAAPQDAVLVAARHIVERMLDGGARLAGAPVGLAAPRRVEARAEKPDELDRDFRIAGQRLLHIGLAEGGAGLAQIFRIGADDRDVPP